MYFLLVLHFLCVIRNFVRDYGLKLWLVNYCTITGIVKIKMVPKVVFGTFVNKTLSVEYKEHIS